jgi:hypothetical protein
MKVSDSCGQRSVTSFLEDDDDELRGGKGEDVLDEESLLILVDDINFR